MTTNDHTISNPVVEAIDRIPLGGSVIPHGWYKALKLPSGKADLTAIAILSDLINWYVLAEDRDSPADTPLLRPRFSGGMFRVGNYFETKHGWSRNRVRRAIKRLEKPGYIRCEYRDLVIQERTIKHALLIEPNPSRILAMTRSERSEKPTDFPSHSNPGGKP